MKIKLDFPENSAPENRQAIIEIFVTIRKLLDMQIQSINVDGTIITDRGSLREYLVENLGRYGLLTTDILSISDPSK